MHGRPAGPVVGEADNASVTASVTSNPAVQTGGSTVTVEHVELEVARRQRGRSSGDGRGR